MIKYIKGDLLRGGDDVIVHGCNCLCKMGAGVALQIKKIYPGAYAADKVTRLGDAHKLGNYTQWTGPNKYFPNKQVTVVNAYTQFDIFSNHSKVPFEYKAFAEVLLKIKEEFKDKSIGLPKIGCGLARGNWNIVEKMINDCFKEKEVKVYII